jgi:mono/diheme cytochrome c family protein
MKIQFAITIAALAWAGASLLAQDGAAIYKKKCAGCHGANGEGKAAVKAPALKGDPADVKQIVDQLMKGKATNRAPHNKAMSGMKPDEASAVAAYVKTLK